MCSACGRPQAGGPLTCVHCGGKLPDVRFILGANESPSGPEPIWHAEFGPHRSLGLSTERIGWRRGPARGGYPLVEVRSARLVVRPLFELLAISVAAAVLLALVPPGWLRYALAVAIGASVFVCFAQRSYALSLKLKDGKTIKVPLAVTGPGASAQRVDRIWASLSVQLEQRGVSVGR